MKAEEAGEEIPNVLTCNECNGIGFAGGIVSGQKLDQKCINCSECNNEWLVDKDELDAVTN